MKPNRTAVSCFPRWPLPAALPLLLAGCMLGPDYVRPDVAQEATDRKSVV